MIECIKPVADKAKVIQIETSMDEVEESGSNPGFHVGKLRLQLLQSRLEISRIALIASITLTTMIL